MNRKVIWGITVKELLLFSGIYSFFAFTYSMTLWLQRGGYSNEKDILFDLKGLFDDSGLQYLVFLFFLIPIWYLLFRALKDLHFTKRLLRSCKSLFL